MRFHNRLVTCKDARKIRFLPVLVLGLLAGCGEDPNALLLPDVQPNKQTTSNISGEESVDGLIVGHRLMDAGEYALALRAYTGTIPERGLTVDVVSAIGSANMKLGRLGQAEDFLRRAVKIDDSFVPAWNNLGVILISRGEFSEAREVFKVAYGLDRGESTDIRANLLLAEEKLANIEPQIDTDANFLLVRRGNGRYLLLGK